MGRAGPERWVWPVAGLGWLMLVAAALADGLGGDHHHHDHHHAGSSVLGSVGTHGLLAIAMVAATMLPLVAWNLNRVGLRSPTARRRVATLEVAVGWAGAWALAVVGLGVVVMLAEWAVGTTAVVVASVVVAVAWLGSPTRRRALARCHRTFAPPLGPAARRACVRFGGSLGRDCVTSCWAPMLVMTAAGHRLAAVVPLAWLGWRDRRRPHDRPRTVVSAVVLVLVGVGVVALAPAS